MDSRKQMNGHKIRAINRAWWVRIEGMLFFLVMFISCMVSVDSAEAQYLVEKGQDTKDEIDVSLTIDQSKGEQVTIKYSGIGGFGAESVEESQISGDEIDTDKIKMTSSNHVSEDGFTFIASEDNQASVFNFNFGKVTDAYQEGFVQLSVDGKVVKK